MIGAAESAVYLKGAGKRGVRACSISPLMALDGQTGTMVSRGCGGCDTSQRVAFPSRGRGVAIITKSGVDARLMRRMLLRTSVVLWLIVTASRLLRGMNVADAAACGGICTLGAFVAWLIYRALRPRSYGHWIFVVAGPMSFCRTPNTMSILYYELGMQAISVVAMVILAAAFETIPSEQTIQPKQSLLWDAEVDQPEPR